MTLQSLFLFISSIFLSLAIGFFTGIWIETTENAKNENVHTQESLEITSRPVPVITLERIENGVLYISKNDAEIRIKMDEELFVANNNILEIPITKILPMLKRLPAPEGMQWVASKRGKKYWPLDSPQAFLVSAKNRIFFKTPEEAEQAGKSAGIKK